MSLSSLAQCSSPSSLNFMEAPKSKQATELLARIPSVFKRLRVDWVSPEVFDFRPGPLSDPALRTTSLFIYTRDLVS